MAGDDAPIELDERDLPQCERCGFPLHHLAMRGDCPECGAAYQRRPLTAEEEERAHRLAQQQWRWWEMQSPRRPKPRPLIDPHCRSCGYPLRTDTIRGNCPECGALYDKGTGLGIRHDESAADELAVAGDVIQKIVQAGSLILLLMCFFGFILVWTNVWWTLISIVLSFGCALLWLIATDRIRVHLEQAEPATAEDDATTHTA